MVHTRAWPRISPSTKIYFRCHFRGFFLDTRQYAAAFVTQCTLSLNDRAGSWAGLCQCGSLVMFCALNAQIMTEVSEKSYTPKILVRSAGQLAAAG